jgi:hypothetical protein
MQIIYHPQQNLTIAKSKRLYLGHLVTFIIGSTLWEWDACEASLSGLSYSESLSLAFVTHAKPHPEA